MVCTHRTPYKHVVGYIYKYLIGDKHLMGLFQLLILIANGGIAESRGKLEDLKLAYAECGRGPV